MSIFDELQKKAEENNERWESIDAVVQELNRVRNDEGSSAKEIAELNSALLLLVVEQLRPMRESSEAAKELKESLSSMLGSIAGG